MVQTKSILGNLFLTNLLDHGSEIKFVTMFILCFLRGIVYNLREVSGDVFFKNPVNLNCFRRSLNFPHGYRLVCFP